MHPAFYRQQVQIRRLDVDDDTDFELFHSVYEAANRAGRPYATTWPLVERRAAYRTPSSSNEQRAYLGSVGDRVVAVGELELPLTENVDHAELTCHVMPDRRRQGHGRAMARCLRAEALAAGRRLATAWVHGGVLDGSGQLEERSPGSHFCQAVGLQERNVDVHRVLDLPVPDQRLDRMAEAAAAHHQAYTIVSWTDPCPDVYVSAYCALKSVMNAEAPLGDLVLEPERWDEQRLRESEAELVAMGRTRHVVAAVDHEGTMVAHNEVLHAVHDPGRLWNWDTLVLPDHRGHRLGLALKVANLRLVQQAHPDGRELHTFNAVQNAPMIAVNDALGFRPVELTGEWQGDLDAMTT